MPILLVKKNIIKKLKVFGQLIKTPNNYVNITILKEDILVNFKPEKSTVQLVKWKFNKEDFYVTNKNINPNQVDITKIEDINSEKNGEGATIIFEADILKNILNTILDTENLIINFFEQEEVKLIKVSSENMVQEHISNYKEIVNDNNEISQIEYKSCIFDFDMQSIYNIHYNISNTLFNKIIGNYTFIRNILDNIEIISTNGRIMCLTKIKLDKPIDLPLIKTIIPKSLDKMLYFPKPIAASDKKTMKEERKKIVKNKYSMSFSENHIHFEFGNQSIISTSHYAEDDIILDFLNNEMNEKFQILIDDIVDIAKICNNIKTAAESFNIEIKKKEDVININIYNKLVNINKEIKAVFFNDLDVHLETGKDVIISLASVLQLNRRKEDKYITIYYNSSLPYAKVSIEHIQSHLFFVLIK